jgi:hypothetical protein
VRDRVAWAATGRRYAGYESRRNCQYHNRWFVIAPACPLGAFSEYADPIQEEGI